jgi:hypothetical protein
MNFDDIKSKLIRYRWVLSPEKIVDYVNKNEIDPKMYYKLRNDKDIIYYFGENKLKKIDDAFKKKNINNIYNNMSEPEEQQPTQGILPSIAPQNSQDGTKPPVKYVSSEDQLPKASGSDAAGSSFMKKFDDVISNTSDAYYLVLGGAALGMMIYLLNKK